MSKSTKRIAKELETTITGKKPNYHAYQIVKPDGSDKRRWTKIGVGFLHRDGGGMNLLLDLLPENGRVTLRSIAQDEPGS